MSESIPPAFRAEMAECFQTITNSLKQESERGCVIVSAAWLEEQLAVALQRYFLPSARPHENDDELFGRRGYLGGLSAKIDVAYRCALIPVELHRSLHLCRRIRNDFAHLSEDIGFNTPSVKNRVREVFQCNEMILNAIWQYISKNEALGDEVRKLAQGETGVNGMQNLLGTRGLFEITVGTNVSALSLVANQLVPIRVKEGL